MKATLKTKEVLEDDLPLTSTLQFHHPKTPKGAVHSDFSHTPDIYEMQENDRDMPDSSRKLFFEVYNSPGQPQ